MNFFLIVFLYLSFVPRLKAQTNEDLFVQDSIINNLNRLDINEKEYYVLKSNILKLENKLGYQPEYKYLLLDKSFQFNDLKFFKIELIELVKNYGFKIDYLSEKEYYFKEIMNGDLSKWFKKMYLKNHFKWLSKNFSKQIDLRKLNELKLKDQLINSMAAKTSLINGLSNDQKEENLKNLSHYFFENALELYRISQKYNFLPTAKNFAVIQNRYGIVEIHNLQSKWNFEKYFDLMFDFYRKAYLNNEITYMIFKNYDNHSYLHAGNQKFGLIKIENIPIDFRKSNNEIPIIDINFSRKIKEEFKWNE